MIITSIVLPLIYREEIIGIGHSLLLSYGQDRIDFILYFITTISSTPLALPVWIYAVLGSILGYEPLRLIIVMGLGSMTGSTITYFIARYFGKSKFVKQNFPIIENHPWTRGRSIWVVSLILFTGAASPIPFDIFYAACGMKRFPILLFAPVLFLAFLIKFAYLFYGYDLIQSYSTLYFNL
jgi:membrane protein YqaA with SNARE-associated domain